MWNTSYPKVACLSLITRDILNYFISNNIIIYRCIAKGIQDSQLYWYLQKHYIQARVTTKLLSICKPGHILYPNFHIYQNFVHYHFVHDGLNHILNATYKFDTYILQNKLHNHWYHTFKLVMVMTLQHTKRVKWRLRKIWKLRIKPKTCEL